MEKMKLITKEIEKKLAKFPLHSQDGKEEKEVVVKFFNPYNGWRCYVCEGKKLEDGDWLFFALVKSIKLNYWVYFTLSELESIRTPFNLGIKRDNDFKGKVKI